MRPSYMFGEEEIKTDYTIFRNYYAINGKSGRSYLCHPSGTSPDSPTNKVDFIPDHARHSWCKLSFDTIQDAFRYLVKLNPSKRLSIYDHLDSGSNCYEVIYTRDYDIDDEQLSLYDLTTPHLCYIQENPREVNYND